MRQRRRLVVVVDAQAAAEIEVAYLRALFFHLAGEHAIQILAHFGQRVDERSDRGKLRADMAVHADDIDMPQRHGFLVGLQGSLYIDAELGLLHSGGNIRMRLRIDVGVDAQRDLRALAERHGDLVEREQLLAGLDVEAADARQQRLLHLGHGLADAREHDLARIAAGLEHARQLAARDDVEAGAELRQHLQHREVRVGLDRVAHEVLMPGQRAVEGVEVARERRARVDVQRRAVAAREFGQRHVLGVQLAAAVLEMVHYFPSLSLSLSLAGASAGAGSASGCSAGR